MRELVVLSGKGGTGKTSVVASLAALARDAVLADCDVDAADLHLLLTPDVHERHDFAGGRVADIRAEDCTACGECEARCPAQLPVMSMLSEMVGPMGDMVKTWEALNLRP